MVEYLLLWRFLNHVDAEFATYRLYNLNYMGRFLKVELSPPTKEEIEERKKEFKEREIRRLERMDKKKKIVKPKAKSLRFLAPVNVPSRNTGNNTSQQQQQVSSQSNQNRPPVSNVNKEQDPKKQQPSNRSRNGGRRAKQGRYQLKVVDQVESTVGEDQTNDNNNDNDNESDHDDNDYPVETEVEYKDDNYDEDDDFVNEDRKFEVVIRNMNSNDENFYYLSQSELDEHFPQALRKAKAIVS